MPVINSKARRNAYGSSIREWWTALQPEWRAEGITWPIRCEAPDGADWSCLCIRGPNGIFLAVMALAWWVVSADGKDDGAFEVVQDVVWVLKQMMVVRSSIPDVSTSVTVETSGKRRKVRTPFGAMNKKQKVV